MPSHEFHIPTEKGKERSYEMRAIGSKWRMINTNDHTEDCTFNFYPTPAFVPAILFLSM